MDEGWGRLDLAEAFYFIFTNPFYGRYRSIFLGTP